MGGAKDTKKNLQQVTADLAGTLLNNAKSLLKKISGTDAAPNAELSDVLSSIAKAQFRDVYQYDFSPLPETIKPPKSLGNNKPCDKLCNITGPIKQQVTTYLGTGILEAMSLPLWMSGVAKADLSAIAEAFLMENTNNKWNVREYSRIYDAMIEDAESFRCDSVMVYCNGVMTEGDQTASICIISYMGLVYYNIDSETRTARNKLEKQGYQAAADITGSAEAPPTHDMLTKMLDKYAEATFLHDFKYDYQDDSPPDSLRKALQSTTPMLGRNSNVLYIPDLGGPKFFSSFKQKKVDEKPKQDAEPTGEAQPAEKVEAQKVADPAPDTTGQTTTPETGQTTNPAAGQTTTPAAGQSNPAAVPIELYVPPGKTRAWAELRKHIDLQIFKGINLEIDSIRNDAIDDVTNVYESVLSNAATGSWGVNRINQAYPPSDPTQNSIRQTGIIMSWSGSITIPESKTPITVHYVYFKTIVYEEVNAMQQLKNELFKQLCNNLRVHNKDPKANTPADETTLKGYLASHAKRRWEEVYKFPFEGEESKPFDLKPGPKGPGRVYAMEKLFYVNSYPASLESINNWMDKQLFTRNSPLFPPHASPIIYDNLRDHIHAYANVDTAKLPNYWHDVDDCHPVIDTSGRGKDLKVYSFYMYALGDLALAKKVGTGDGKPMKQGIHQQFLFVYYLGIVSGYTPYEW